MREIRGLLFKVCCLTTITLCLSGCTTIKRLFTQKDDGFSVEKVLSQYDQDKLDALSKYDKLGKAVERSNNAQLPSPAVAPSTGIPPTEIPKEYRSDFVMPIGQSWFENPYYDETVYIIRNGNEYHRISCPVLGHVYKGDSFPIPLSKARLSYTPCSKCNPPY